MAHKPTRIAPPAIIAQAAAALYAQIAANTTISDAERELYINATTKAWNQLLEGIRFEREDDEFVFPSRTRAGISHRVNGKCTCEASAELGQPCWHRAAKKLVLLMEAPTVPARSATPATLVTSAAPAAAAAIAPIAPVAPIAPIAPAAPAARRGPGRNPRPTSAMPSAPTPPAAPAPAIAPGIPQEGKAIIFDDATGDFAMFYNGALIGYRARYQQAERDLDEHAYQHLRHAA